MTTNESKLPTVKLTPSGALEFNLGDGEPTKVVDLGLPRETMLNLLDFIRRALDQTFDVVATYDTEAESDALTEAHDAAELAILKRIGAEDGHLYTGADDALKYAQAFAALRGAR